MFCPICKKNSIEKYRPFCSNRCEKIDLYNWFNNNYSIPAQENDIDEEDLKELDNQEDSS